MKYKEKISELINDSEKGSFPLMGMICSLSWILAVDAETRMRQEYPHVVGKKIKAKAQNKVTLPDVLNVLSGFDFSRSTAQALQGMDFMKWFLEKDMGDDTRLWYTLEKIKPLWNEYAIMHNNKEDKK